MNYIMFAGMIGDTAKEFGVDWPHFLAQVISFGIVAFLLQRFAYRPVLQMLQERQQRIAETAENSEKVKAELARAEEQHREILAQANAQATKLIEEAKAAAAKVQERETQKAIASAEQIITKARQAADQDHARMLGELKREVGRLVIQTTATVTGKVLTPEDHQRLSEETVKAMPAA